MTSTQNASTPYKRIWLTDTTEADMELNTVLPFGAGGAGGGGSMSPCHLINYVMAFSFSFFRKP